ncbi:MAG TPA: pinensin family lanthipeptide [Longimicrobium sp.]|jgi:hypothetical protein|uniref:pinensin family lanthipeptide n=1 Tax=Longimicrobium sp. TaxID=2029185 RepID=UPI002EDB6E0B
MKKLTLKFDELRVESFETSFTQADRRGTVQGHYSLNGTCPFSCGGSCDATCPDSCAYTCQGTCANSCLNSCDFTCECDGLDP